MDPWASYPQKICDKGPQRTQWPLEDLADFENMKNIRKANLDPERKKKRTLKFFYALDPNPLQVLAYFDP